MTSYGPFSTERDADSTPPAVRAHAESSERYKTMGPGCHIAPNAQIILDVCKAAGVELGEFDRRVLTGLGNWETFVSSVVGDVIERAYKAGQRAEQDRIAADLRRAAEGRREYAERDADDAPFLLMEAGAYHTAAAITMDRSHLLDVLPSWRWTGEERETPGKGAAGGTD